MRDYPEPFNQGPAKGVKKLNQFLRAVRENHVVNGPGIQLRETADGVFLTLNDAILNYFGLNGNNGQSPGDNGTGGLGPAGSNPPTPSSAGDQPDDKKPSDNTNDPNNPNGPNVEQPNTPTTYPKASSPFQWYGSGSSSFSIDGINGGAFEVGHMGQALDVNIGYTETVLNTDGTGVTNVNYFFSYIIASGTLDPAITVSVQGNNLVFSGTPTVPSNCTILIKATPAEPFTAPNEDMNGHTITFNLRVINGAFGFSNPDVTLPDGVWNTAWSAPVINFVGGVAPYTITTSLYGVSSSQIQSVIGSEVVGGSIFLVGSNALKLPTVPTLIQYPPTFYLTPGQTPPQSYIDALAAWNLSQSVWTNSTNPQVQPYTNAGTITVTDSQGSVITLSKSFTINPR